MRNELANTLKIVTSEFEAILRESLSALEGRLQLNNPIGQQLQELEQTRLRSAAGG